MSDFKVEHEGRVTFENGEIVMTEFFIVSGTIMELQEYVRENYKFLGEIPTVKTTFPKSVNVGRR